MSKKWNVLAAGCILAVMMCGLAGCGKKAETATEEITESVQALNELAEVEESIKDADLPEEEIGTEAEEESISDEKGESDMESDAVDPDLKAFLDGYEAFMDEYIDFMKKYQDSGNSPEMLSDYLEIMQKYSEFAAAVEKYDTEEMSAADAAYYLEVTTRISEKSLEALY